MRPFYQKPLKVLLVRAPADALHAHAASDAGQGAHAMLKFNMKEVTIGERVVQLYEFLEFSLKTCHCHCRLNDGFSCISQFTQVEQDTIRSQFSKKNNLVDSYTIIIIIAIILKINLNI